MKWAHDAYALAGRCNASKSEFLSTTTRNISIGLRDDVFISRAEVISSRRGSRGLAGPVERWVDEEIHAKWVKTERINLKGPIRYWLTDVFKGFG